MLLGFMQWRWTPDARSLTLPTNDWHYVNGWLRINWTQAIGMIFPIVLTVVTALFLNRTKVGTAMRALADNRENTALLGVPVRRGRGRGMVRLRRGVRLLRPAAGDAGLDGDRRPDLLDPDRGTGGGADRADGLVVGHARRGVRDRDRAVEPERHERASAEYRNMTPFVFAIIVLLWFAWRGAVHGRMA